MDDRKVRCLRCSGRKQLYKMGGAYSLIDTGGTKVDCPLCMGAGVIKPLEVVAEEVLLENIDKTFDTTDETKRKKKK